ncbi:hypothetical protein NQ117_07030 [Paenibacillus sp. SC116]|uniref:hypothetical protein n=1 Tax=Paenibacillus sp. SC116 TaxID=2968986 RepID=UPI00215A7A6F|nr:hypothetical protein [Paenibacillus sp. SC116]MCR8843432.1 hypothetical protein [Paenibacillus sp. SC116]
MNIQMKRSSIPILWLDTNVVIDMTKYRENAELKDLQRDRVSKLINVIYQKTRSGKLLYVEGDQDEEINSLNKEAHKTQSFLSMGIKLQYRKAIHDDQLFAFMDAYVNKRDAVILDYRDAFYSDPVEKLKDRNNGYIDGLIISAYSEVTKTEIQERTKRKEVVLGQLNELRQTLLDTGVTYEQQLQTEYAGVIQAIRVVIEKMRDKLMRGLSISTEDYDQISIITELERTWGQVTDSREGLIEFLQSDCYKQIPFVDIASKLFAKIVTSITPVVSGDSMDVEHISTVLPYSDIIVTDRKMKNRIVQLGLDKKYEARVFCLNDIENILSEIEKL